MTLETLKGIKEIGGFEIKRVSWNPPKNNFIEVNTSGNGVTFNIQQGSVKENGVNGCQVDAIIETALIMVKGLDVKVPCTENKQVIEGLSKALVFLGKRKKRIKSKEVE